MKRRMMMLVGIIAIMIAMLLCYGTASAEGGTFDGIDWDLTNGVLTLGNGDTQTLLDNDNRTKESWPWYEARESITSVVCNGTLIMKGSLSGMFYDCINMTQFDSSGWDMTGVESIGAMFYCCKGLTELDLSHWNVSNVVRTNESLWPYYGLFCGCSGLTNLNLSGWDTSSMTGMANMFQSCSSLTSLNLSSFNTSNVTTMNGMFYGCSSLITIDVSNFDTANVTNMGSMFGNCSQVETLNLSNFDTGNVTGMDSMFMGCENLTSLNIAGFDTHSLTGISQMFRRCKKLTSLDLSGWDTSSLVYAEAAFMTCLALSDLDVSTWDVSHVTNMREMFYECLSLTELDVSHWNPSSCTNMYRMFLGDKLLETLDVSAWNTSSVTTMEGLFFGCESLTYLDVSGWDVSHVVDMNGMFRNCKKLEFVDVSHWDVGSVTTMKYMFLYDENLNGLDVSNWDVSCVTDFEMFVYNCKKLDRLDISQWDVSNARNLGWMCYGCPKLNFLDLSNWNPSSATVLTDAYGSTGCLREVMLDEADPFHGANGASVVLPSTYARIGDVAYTGKWIREDGTAGPYTPEELRDNYTSAMAGKWVWEKVPTEYSITFVCNEDGYFGEMPPVTVEASENYTLPGNAFRVFGYEFDHWMDSTGWIWMDKDTIPANTYAVNAEVTLTAVFGPRDTFIIMQDGAFDFSIKADEKALFSPLPASTAYQVYEQTPFGWNLVAQTDASGVIAPDAESEALFLNKYDPLKVTVRFAGTKLMDGGAAEVDSFNFLLYEDDTLVDITSVGDGGLIEFQPITYDQAGTHHYYICEAVGNDVAVSYDTHVEEITVEITADGVGHLYADVAMDEDEILFENASKPGYLALSKVNAVDDNRTGTFLYEIQFITENGQPYELFSGDITYEERDEEISELPVGQPIEKPKYALNLQHFAKNRGNVLSEQYYDTEEHNGGEVIIIAARDISTGYNDRQYILTSVDNDFVRTLDGTWKGVMPNRDLEVHLVYEQYADFIVQTRWNGEEPTDAPEIDAIILYADGEQYRVADSVRAGDTYMFEKCPVFNESGNYIDYTIDVPDMEGYYIVGRKNGTYSATYGLNYGFNGDIIWDDMDNYYGLRPNALKIHYSQYLTSYSTTIGDNYGGWHYGHQFYRDPDVYPVTVSIEDCPVGYEVITFAQDPTLEKYDLKLKLVSIPTAGTIVWDDNDNSAGKRPDSVVVHIMDGTLDIDQMVVDDADDWAFVLEYPVPLNEGPLTYTIRVEDVEDYTASIDGTTVTMTQMFMVDITVTDVTLLSASEYNAYRSQIPSISAYWWLRGPGSWWSTSMYVPSNVMPDGSVEIFYASNGTFGIRPVLVCDFNGTGLEIGNKLRFVGYDWTVISDSLVLCDSCVGNAAFGPGNTWVKSQSETLTTPYDDSYAKPWVENWAIEKGIMSEPEFEIIEVTLLSKNEYDTYRDEIAFDMAQWWWLRSPGSSSMYANFVRSDTGNVGNYAHSVSTDYFGVRPALICDLNDVGYSVGDKVSGSGYEWTVISNSISVTDDPYNGHGLILCDETVGQTAFRADNTASDANVYDVSDVKQWLANWVASHPFWAKTVTVTVTE